MESSVSKVFMPPHMAARYRPDIDGLRAIAVVSVIVFHIWGSMLPGGFVGVDIFFVISGYLITRNIVIDLEKGNFTIADFYRRRIKRIVPAMLVVVLLTVLFANILMLPDDARAATKSGIFSVLSLANVFFWLYQDTSYFAMDSSQLPLLHLWSLGVEEQFYFIWPLFLLWLYTPQLRRIFLIGSAVAAFGSFLLAQQLFYLHPLFTYYMLPTRAGELLLGSIISIAALHRVERHILGVFVTPMAIVGTTLIIGSIVLLSSAVPFPGWLALPVTLGASLIILAGHCQPNRISGMLSTTPLVWIGKRSYSAYLWHWPLLAFYRYGYGGVGHVAGFALLTLTLVIAALSYRWIEQPSRNVSASGLRVLLMQYLIPGGVMSIMGVVAIYPAHFDLKYPSESYQKKLSQISDLTEPAYMYDWVCQRQRIRREDLGNKRCVLGANGGEAPQAILWGDSNAAHYVGVVEAIAKKEGFRFRNIEVGSCPPIAGDPSKFVDPERSKDCRRSLEIVNPFLSNFRTVIISASWPDYQRRSPDFMGEFFETVRALAVSGKRVVLIGKAPVIKGYDRLCREKELTFPFLRCKNTEAPPQTDVTMINQALRKFADETPNVTFYDVAPYICQNGVCSAYDRNSLPRYFDEAHLSLPASVRLGKEIVAREGIPEAFRGIAQ